MRKGWKIYALRTTTGEVGSQYDPVDATWGITLNSTEALSLTIKKAELRRREKLWYTPWSGGTLLTFTGYDGIENPIIAGPIIDYGYETADEITLECAGIRKIFERRLVGDDLSYKDMTYGEIAWALINHGMDKPGGALPIVHGIPAEDGRYVRNYDGWNLANNDIDKLLTELSEVIAGPDMMFRPVWANDEHTKIVWSFVHGTQLTPNIPQSVAPDFDTTAPVADIGLPTIASSAAVITNRVWCTGSGEGEGIARVYAQNLKSVEAGAPFLETVMSVSDQSEQGALQSKAAGALAAGLEMIDQVTFSVRANSRKHPMGSYFVGDTAMVTLKGWLNIGDGTRPMKLLKANGNLSDAVALSFQEGTWS